MPRKIRAQIKFDGNEVSNKYICSFQPKQKPKKKKKNKEMNFFLYSRSPSSALTHSHSVVCSLFRLRLQRLFSHPIFSFARYLFVFRSSLHFCLFAFHSHRLVIFTIYVFDCTRCDFIFFSASVFRRHFFISLTPSAPSCCTIDRAGNT